MRTNKNADEKADTFLMEKQKRTKTGKNNTM